MALRKRGNNYRKASFLLLGVLIAISLFLLSDFLNLGHLAGKTVGDKEPIYGIPEEPEIFEPEKIAGLEVPSDTTPRESPSIGEIIEKISEIIPEPTPSEPTYEEDNIVEKITSENQIEEETADEKNEEFTTLDTLSCGQTISTSVTMDNDLYCPTGNGLVMGTGGKLDCQGHNITGNFELSSKGISIFNQNNIEIKNCIIYNFHDGIYDFNVNYANITNNTIVNVTTYGIFFARSSYLNISSNMLNISGAGIYLTGVSGINSTNFIVDNNEVNNANTGISTSTSLNFSLTNNIVNYPGTLGMDIKISLGNANITDNFVRFSRGHGYNLVLQSGSPEYQNYFLRNKAINSSQHGLQIGTFSNLTSSDNEIYYSNWSGIYASSGTVQSIFTNTFSCFNNQSGQNYYDIYDQDSNTWIDTTCDTKNGATVTCDQPCTPSPNNVPNVTNIRIYSDSNTTDDPLLGYCNATDTDGDDLIYDYIWYNDSSVFINGTLFKEGSIDAGNYHTCGIRQNDNRILCWGLGNDGVLGDGNAGSHEVANPTLTTDTSPYISVSAGNYHTCGIRQNDSRVLCWGLGTSGRLGDGSITAHSVGTPTLTTDTSPYISVSAADQHTCGIRQNDSRVLCWGAGLDGVLGDGLVSFHYNANPTLTTDTSPYISVSAADYHTCGIRANDSRVLCWGNGEYGKLGDGSIAAHSVGNPNLTTDTSPYISVSAAFYSTYGIRQNDNRVLFWGRGRFGESGDGNTNDHNVSNPNLTTDTSPFTSVSAKRYHTCGIRQNDSRVLCWGLGTSGRLGDGNAGSHNVGNPNLTTDTSPYISVSAADQHTCGIRQNDSRVLCWGNGDYSQLGDGNTNNHDVGNPNLTTDTSPYGVGFSEGQEQLVSIISIQFLNINDNWTFSCRAYDFINYSDWKNSSNITIQQIPDEEYPIFSNYWDNSYNYTGSGTARFNVTLINTNGTVFLEINGNNYTASNLSSVYNVSVPLSNGTYDYYWGAWGNGTDTNYNTSGLRSYTINNPPENPPNVTEFDGGNYGSTNFSEVTDIENVTNMTLANQYGRIQFPVDYGVNASNEDYDEYIEIGTNFISVNTSQLDKTFNTSTNVTINNVFCPATIYFGENTYASAAEIISGGNICNSTSNPSCTNIICNGNLTFTPSHFTGFASAGTTNLTIWDETDSGMPYGDQVKYQNEQIKFFANYTNSTSTLSDATCVINFTDSSDYMSWNSTANLFDYNRSFSSDGIFGWNVTCNKTDYDTLFVNDTVNVSVNCPGGMSGDNTIASPCMITNCTQLQNMSLMLGNHYALANDINCSDTVNWDSGKGFNPLGCGWSDCGTRATSVYFTGSFDGRNYTINNMYINRIAENFVALFGYTLLNVNISNVGMVNVNFTGKEYIGGFAGYTESTISNSYTTGSVNGSGTIGGFVGNNWGTISNSYSTVSVTSKGSFTGGLVGANGANINDSYATGNVNGTSYTGGLVGYDSGITSNSYSTGNVNGTSYTGGLVGYFEGTISNLYWNNHTGNPGHCWTNSTGNYSDGCTAVQDNEAYFFDINNAPMTSWSFPPWDNFCDDNGYPSLEWENITNVTECLGYSVAADDEYPRFSNYYDNNASLIDSGTALFNVTIESTNGTVFLEIDGNNYTATNLTTNVYNVSVTLTNGTYDYYWGTWGNGTDTNYNTSGLRSYTVNKSLGCGDTIITNTNLTKNYQCNSSHGFVIGANNIIFDCKDYGIVGNQTPNTYGINISNYDGIIIRNCIINNFTNGIYLLNADYTNITWNNLTYNTQNGILLVDSSNNIILENEIMNNTAGSGIYIVSVLDTSTQNTIVNNTIINHGNTGFGIKLESADNNLIYNNFFNNTYNAYDDSSGNDWNITKTAGTNIINRSYIGGNFWSDYYGNDTTGDYLGDQDIPYNAQSQILNGGDYLPLVYETYIDTIPNVSLIEPIANYVNTTEQYVNLTFTANASDDHGLENCSLWHNISTWHRNQTQDVTGTENITMFNLTDLTNISFIWNIECTDNGNQNTFADTNRTITLTYCGDGVCTGGETCSGCPTDCGTCPAPPSGGGGGGGGGAPAPTGIITYDVSNNDFENGYTDFLGENEQFRFYVDNELHTIHILEVTSLSTKINVTSESQIATLFIGDLKEFDVNGDGYSDLTVILAAIDTFNDKALLTIKRIFRPAKEVVEKIEGCRTDGDCPEGYRCAYGDCVLEEIEVEAPEEIKEALNLIKLLMIIVAILIIIITMIPTTRYYLKRKRLREKASKRKPVEVKWG